MKLFLDPPCEPEFTAEGQPLDLMNLPFDPAQAAMRACRRKQTGK
jgi:hypothetical protein